MKLATCAIALSLFLPLLPSSATPGSAAAASAPADPRAADASYVPAADVKSAAASVAGSEAQHTTADSAEGKMNAAKLPDALKALLVDFINPSHPEHTYFAELKRDSQKQLGFTIDENDDPIFIIRVTSPTFNAAYKVTTCDLNLSHFERRENLALITTNRVLVSPQIRFLIAHTLIPQGTSRRERLPVKSILSDNEYRQLHILRFSPRYMGRHLDRLYLRKKRLYLPRALQDKERRLAVVNELNSNPASLWIPKEVQNIILEYSTTPLPPAPRWGCTAREARAIHAEMEIIELLMMPRKPYEILKDEGAVFHECEMPVEMILSDDHDLNNYLPPAEPNLSPDLPQGCCAIS